MIVLLHFVEFRLCGWIQRLSPNRGEQGKINLGNKSKLRNISDILYIMRRADCCRKSHPMNPCDSAFCESQSAGLNSVVITVWGLIRNEKFGDWFVSCEYSMTTSTDHNSVMICRDLNTALAGVHWDRLKQLYRHPEYPLRTAETRVYHEARYDFAFFCCVFNMI